MNYPIVHQLSETQIDDLVSLYANEFWSNRRTRDGVVKMLRNTDLLFAAVDGAGRVVAFCRVLTDFVYRAWVYDVIVSPAHRGEGLARLVLDAMLDHPKLKDVETIDLTCRPEMAAMYQKWGFVTDSSGTIRMRRKRSSAG
jgi:ribosomal protein S18 acetylase RimI-like enzyme